MTTSTAAPTPFRRLSQPAKRSARLAQGWRKFGHEIGFGIGIAQGHATLGRIGFEGRSDYAAIGVVTFPRLP